MRPDRVSNPGPLTYESGALLTALLTGNKQVRLACERKIGLSGHLVETAHILRC